MAGSSSSQDPLRQLIREEIGKSGPISCERFIELALYHPDLGYYAQDRLRISRRGDFITNVSVGDVFGSILAGQISELWELAGKPAEFVIVEPGAESGDLASDIVSSLARDHPGVPCQYVILEPHPGKQAHQQGRLAGAPVRWIRDWPELGTFGGIVIANEFLDALPCRVIERTADEWKEVCVGIDGDRFGFHSRQITCSRLAAESARLPGMPFLPYRTEINLAARDWVNRAARHLAHGYLLFIDYGYPASEYYSPLRTQGTLTGYRAQQRQDNILEGIGETDITAHVDFTTVAQAASEAGCQAVGFTDQHHFMVGAAENRLLAMEKGGVASGERERFLRAFKTLMHPETMGLAFKYLLLGKGLPDQRAPSGFRYAPQPRMGLDVLTGRQLTQG